MKIKERIDACVDGVFFVVVLIAFLSGFQQRAEDLKEKLFMEKTA